MPDDRTKEQLIEEAQANIGGLGWKKQPLDARDWKFKAKFGAADISALPRQASLRANMPPIRDQRQSSACTGFASTYAVGHLRRTDEDLHSTIYSPLFAYYCARMIEGDQWIAMDEGAYIRNVIKGLVTYGVPPESKWQFYSEAERFKRRPPPSVWRQALRWRLGGYYLCEDWTDILHAIALGHPVVGGFSCFASMFTAEVSRTGRIPYPRLTGDALLGGHAVCFAEYNLDAPDAEVGFPNSWGMWGQEGWGTLPLRMVQRRDMVNDCWVMVSEA